ncbi:cobalamin-binding protein [Paraglaciecola sp. 25GB23A]|uniref:cobalamin-binding protein n=1 Tax=Paraglaciecola sp. 25GB23A TaxID=3156068 RepID=UPI0032AEEAAB
MYLSVFKINFFSLFFLTSLIFSSNSNAIERIISLAPHTTELIYTLGAGDKLVAVSDYSDYPSAAASLPSVANHNGIDIEAIMRLKPDLIVAWQGGNKPQDLARLVSLGFNVYASAPQSPADISQDIIQLGKIIGQEQQAQIVAQQYDSALADIKQRYSTQSKKQVFYYLWTAPLMTIGADAWASKLIHICGATQIFDDSPIPYPEVSKEQVIGRQPSLLIAAMNITVAEAKQYWQSTATLLSAPVLVVNPDELHRFTPRLIDGLSSMCKKINGF